MALVVFDILKIPIIIFLLAPIWGLMDLIYILRGKNSIFLRTIFGVSIMGIVLWIDLIGLDKPRWMQKL
jgi:hypothetical protein